MYIQKFVKTASHHCSSDQNVENRVHRADHRVEGESPAPNCAGERKRHGEFRNEDYAVKGRNLRRSTSSATRKFSEHHAHQ
jgi:hypothetical protein